MELKLRPSLTLGIRVLLGLCLAAIVVMLVIPICCARPSYLAGHGDDETFTLPRNFDAGVRLDSGEWHALDRVVVVLKTRTSPRRVDRLARSIGARVVGQRPQGRYYQFELPTRTRAEQEAAAATLRRHAAVEDAWPWFEPQFRLRPLQVEDLPPARPSTGPTSGDPP